MLKFIYCTDLHGDIRKYNDVFNTANEYDIKLIHLGADLLPKGSHILKEQKKFVNGYLKGFYNKCKENGITVLCMWGNDDIYTRKPYFREYSFLLDEHPYTQDGYEFTGYPFVPDYPFGLKTACKLDYKGWRMKEELLGVPVDVNESGFVPINDLDAYFKAKGTIEDDLKTFKGGNKAIVAMHCPPQGFDLDVCYGGRRVGSKAIAEWVKKEKPLLLLCGHLHESYTVTGVWKVTSGNTTIIQPGQKVGDTSMVHIEINESSVNAHLITL
jgi:Icc-related predicted phosphoesterase